MDSFDKNNNKNAQKTESDRNNNSKEPEKPFHAYEGDEPFIFVSHSHEDLSEVYPEIKRFHDDGFNIWYDEGIYSGTTWIKTLADKVYDCLVFVVFISHNSVKSKYVLKEIKYADTYNKTIIPIYLEDIELPREIEFIIVEFQAIQKYNLSENDYINKYQTDFNKIFDDYEKDNNSNISAGDNNEIEELFRVIEKKSSDLNKKNSKIFNQMKNYHQKAIKEQNEELLNIVNKQLKSVFKSLEKLFIKDYLDKIDETDIDIIPTPSVLLNLGPFRDKIVKKTFFNLKTSSNFLNQQLADDLIQKGHDYIDNDAGDNLEEVVIKLYEAQKESTINISEEEYKEEEQTDNLPKDNLVTENDDTIEEIKHNFKYLDKLIHSGQKEIRLEQDIILDEDEIKEYSEGIKLDVDNIRIEGNGYKIDAQEKTRIFFSTGKNIIIKNVTLQNAYSIKNGAAVNNDRGKITIQDSVFQNNKSKSDGGAINNQRNGIVKLISCSLTKNEAKNGGAINNRKAKTILKETTLSENTAQKEDGSIHTSIYENIKIENCEFIDNKPEESKTEVNITDNTIDNVELYITVTDAKTDKPIPDGLITVSLYGDIIGTGEIVDGKSIIEANIDEKGTYDLLVVYEGNENFTKSDITLKQVEVVGHSSEINIVEINTVYGSASITVKMIDSFTNEYISDAEIIVELPNSNEINMVTDKKGSVEIPLELPVGDNTITIIFDGDKTHDSTNATYTFSIEPCESTILAEITNDIANDVTILATVADKKTKESVQNGSVLIKVDDTIVGSGEVVDGKASIHTNITDSGVYDFYIEYTGNENYTESKITLDNIEIYNVENVSEVPVPVYNGDEPYIFFAFDYIDYQKVYPDLKRFYEEGYNICYEDGITLGNSWVDVEKAIKHCKLFVVFMSRNSVESKNVRDEIYLANFENIPVLPIYIQKTNLKHGLRHILGSIQSLLKYQMNKKEYIIGYRKEFEKHGFNIKQKGTDVEVESLNNISRWETAKIFIDGTFNDMHAERNYLIKEVIPEVKEWCFKRKILLKEVDLRWGVTEEDVESNGAIDITLRTIDKCRPFYICFLGQRRGWVPDFHHDVNDETKARYPNIYNYEGLSVTEMGINHALLNPLSRVLNDKLISCPPTKYSLFFFRDEEYVKELSPAQKYIYTNDLDDDSLFSDKKLEETKEYIRRKKIEEDKVNAIKSDDEKIHIEITEYKGIWDNTLEVTELAHYDSNESEGKLTDFKCGEESLKDVLIAQLQEQLMLAFPNNYERKNETELEEDLDQQNQFCYLNSEGYIKRDETRELEDYINSDSNSTLLVTAYAGYGKTMFLSNFILDMERKGNDNLKIFKRFCGASNLSSQVYSLWKSIIDEAIMYNLTDLTVYDELYPRNLSDLRKNFKKLLQKISQKQKTIIVLDAINQLPGGMNILNWLCKLPENLKIIISTKKDEANAGFLEVISSKSSIYKRIELEKLTNKNKKELIKTYLRSYLKELSDEQIDTICAFKGSDNPLYLKILISELRVFGSFYQLRVLFEKDEMGRIPLEEQFGQTPTDAFSKVLERLEYEEKEVDDYEIVKYIFRLLSNANVGLSEDEIVTITSKEKEVDKKIVQDVLRITLRQLRPFMAIKENRVDFFYDSFKLASQNKYMDYKKEDNKSLSDYFLKQADPEEDYTFKGDNLRDFVELPYHLSQAEEKEVLEKILLSYNYINKKLVLSNIYNCISDYQLVRIDDDEIEEDSIEEALNLTEKTLELSAPILINHKEQLPEQLWGRMNEIPNIKIKEILNELTENTNTNWLKSTTSSLYSPNTPIIKRIRAEGLKTSSLAITNDKRIIIGTTDGKLNIYNIEDNYLEVIEERDSPIIKIILLDEGEMLVASQDGIVNQWNISDLFVNKIWKINEQFNSEITDIYYSKTYNKIYASSHTAIYTINLETDEIRKEDIEEKNYNQILESRRNGSILLCDEKEVDGWDIFDMRKIYNQHQQHELTVDDVEDISKSKCVSGEIRFMGLIKRFLILISENGQMNMWNTLKKSGSGESIDEVITLSPQDKFAQAVTIEEEGQVIIMSKMGVLRVYNIPEPRHPTFRFDTYNKEATDDYYRAYKDIQTGITDSTALTYYADNNKQWVIVGNESNDINIIDLNKEVGEIEHSKHIESVLAIKINDETMITASCYGEYYRWDINNEQVINRFKDEFRYDCLSYNQSEDRLICCGTKQEEDGHTTIHKSIWQNDRLFSEELLSKKLIDVAQNNTGIVSIDNENLIVGDNKIKLERLASTICTIYDTEDVFIGFEDGSIAKYSNGKINYERNNTSQVRKIKTTSDKVIVGHEDGKLEIYNHNMDYIKTIEAHNEAITDIHVKNDLEFITSSEDKTLKIWNIENGNCLYNYYLDVYATAINMKNDKIIIGDSLGNVRFFLYENN